MDKFKDYGEKARKIFMEGYETARNKTEEALEKELTPLQKVLVLAGVLTLGILIGLLIGKCLHKDDYELEDFEDFEELDG